MKNIAAQGVPNAPTTKGELIFAVTNVIGSTKACAARGDEAFFALIERYYATAAREASSAGGRFVKGMGDGILLIFPSAAPAAVVEALQSFQAKANRLWQEFDQGCHVQVKLGIGTVISGNLGAPGDEHFDVIGNALNLLIKAPWGDFEISPQLSERL